MKEIHNTIGNAFSKCIFCPSFSAKLVPPQKIRRKYLWNTNSIIDLKFVKHEGQHQSYLVKPVELAPACTENSTIEPQLVILFYLSPSGALTDRINVACPPMVWSTLIADASWLVLCSELRLYMGLFASPPIKVSKKNAPRK